MRHSSLASAPIALLVLSGLVGCAATALMAGAVRVGVSREAAPGAGSFTGQFTSNKKLAQGAMNDMRNAAFDLGANYVVLEESKAGNTSSGSMWSSHGGQTDVTQVGNAYTCPPADIGM